jgi:hypothetical protein
MSPAPDIPPQLRPLAENNPDMFHMANSILPGSAAQDAAFPLVRHQDTAHNFDCRGFAGAIWPDVADNFPLPDLKGYIPQRLNGNVFPPEQ